MQQPSPFVADSPAAAGAPAMQAGAAADGGAPPELAPSRSVQNSDAVLMARCTQAVEQCRANLADLRTAVKAANSHREKCAELLGAATEAVVALEFMLYDPNIDLPRERALQSLASRVQTAMDQGEAVVKVYGHMSGIAKLASKVCSPGTPLKFDETTQLLASLAKQARQAREQPPAARMPSAPSALAGVGSLVAPLGSQPPLPGSGTGTASAAFGDDAPSSDAGAQASMLAPAASGLPTTGVLGGGQAAASGAAQVAAGAAQVVAGVAQAGSAAAQAAGDAAQVLVLQASGEQSSVEAAPTQIAAPSSSSQLVVGSRLVPEEAMQACRIRKGSRGQAITALVHVPPTEEQPPGHLGFLWFYLSRGLFSGSLYRRDLSKQEDWELRDARHGPDVSCMCYDDVNDLVWTGHRNGGIRAWPVAQDEALLDLYRAFHSSVSAITTDERGCCWAASDKGKVRCFQLEALEADGIHQGYRIAKLGELNTVSEGVPVEYGNAEIVNGMVVHPLAREPAHYGPVRSIAAARGRVWTCGGSSAFASFKEWTQQGVLLGSQSMRLTGLANDMVLVSQVVNVQENQRVSVNAPGAGAIGSFSVGGVASLATASRMTVNQVVDVEMPWQLLTVHDSGAIQVWGVVDKVLVPLVRIGDRVAPALRLIVCEPLGVLITAHNDGRLRLRALPHPRSPECINVVYQGPLQDDQLHKVTDATLPCAQIETSKTGLAQAVGGGMLGVITASNYATIKHFPTAELRRVLEEHNADHPDRQIKIWPAANVDAGQFPMLQLSPAGLTHHVDEVQRAQAEMIQLNSLEYQSSLGAGSRFDHDSEGGAAPERSAVITGEKWRIDWSDLRTIRIIGEGAFGKVWLGRWQETDVAIKQLGSLSALGVDTGSLQHDSSGGIKLDKEVQRALEKEVGLLQEMRHPNIILFMGVVLEPAAVVTEYCLRGSLYDLLKTARQNGGLAKALDWPKRITMALDAAKGMLYLHGHKPPIIHRDLKSPNLLVEKSWRVKVTDFNLSRVSRTDNVASVQSMVANNPRWQPPEVILRQQYGKESDVYAFGLIMWELLTWELPFAEMSTLQIMLAVTQQGKRPPVPTQYEAAQLPGGTFSAYDAWVALMQRCWAEKPEERPTFEQVINDLRKIGAAVADAKQRPPAGAMLRSAGSRNFARAVGVVMASNSSRGLQASSSSGALAAAAAAAQQQPAAVPNGAPALRAPAAPSPFNAPVAVAGAAGAARLVDSAYTSPAPQQAYAQQLGSESTTPDGPLSTRTSGSALPTTASGSVMPTTASGSVMPTTASGSVMPTTASGSVALGGATSGASVLSGTPAPPSPFDAPAVISSAAPPPPGPFSSAPAVAAAVIASNAAVPAGPFGGGPAPWLQQSSAPAAGQAVASNAPPPPSPFGDVAPAAAGQQVLSSAPPAPSPFGGGPTIVSAASAGGAVISSNAPPPPSPFGDGPATSGQAVLSSAPPPPSTFGGGPAAAGGPVISSNAPPPPSPFGGGPAVASAPVAAGGPVISSNAPPPPSPFGDGPAAAAAPAAGASIASNAPPPPSPFGGGALPAGVAVSSNAPPPPSPFGGLAAVATAAAPAGPASAAAAPQAPASPMSRLAARQPPDVPFAHAPLHGLPSTVLEATPSVEAAAARADEWPGSATSPSGTVGGAVHPLATIPSGGTDDAMASAPSGGRRSLVGRLRKSLSGNARQRGAQS